MVDVILYQPEIPPNTGNIIRLCANTGAHLHLIKPLGFVLEDKQLLRAGLDYHEFASIRVHASWKDCRDEPRGARFFAISTKGKQRYDLVTYSRGDAFLFVLVPIVSLKLQRLELNILETIATQNSGPM